MLQLANLFQENMILQRGKKIPVWGQTNQSARVEAQIQGNEYAATADENGSFCVEVGPLVASDSETLSILSDGDRLELTGVAVGDVFLAGGQSNMEYHMRYEKYLTEELEACETDGIRFFDMPEVAYERQDQEFDYSKVGFWRKASKENLEYFSAVGYYFAKLLHREEGIPVGIIGLNWGGTRTGAWMSEAHAREICPEQVEDFYSKLQGSSYEELVAEAGKNPLNDRGFAKWDPFGEFIMPRTPDAGEIAAFFAKLQEAAGFDLSKFQELPDVKHYPGCLYERMVKKAAPFGVKGVLWYQGESDDEVEGSAAHYAKSLKTLIADWRMLWQEESLPFFVVQLPGFRSWLEVVNQDYPLIREAQEQCAREDADVYLCSISDIGEEYDIHPKNKRDVGKRLGLLALKYLYEKDILADAPQLESVRRDGEEIRLQFQNAGKSLSVMGDTVEALVLSAEGKQLSYGFRVEGSELVLRPEKLTDTPVKLAFARDKFYQVNLFNENGIPAIPFETEC